MRTYYDVLGVAADTPDVVIKAAFRALAKEYHPDRTNADAGDTERFIEIQAAYAVLSKPDSRSEYDAELRDSAVPHLPAIADGPATNGYHSPVPWPAPSQAMADIERICARLSLYSEALAQSFHEAYLRGECGEEPLRYAEEMEKSFFREYFGEDPDVQALARLLLLGSRTGAALTLNQLVAGGASSPAKDVRTILALILDQHFKDEALFTDWLKVKFGLAALDAQPLPQEQPAAFSKAETETPAAAAPPPQRARPLQRAKAFRSVALLFMWAVALYFALFAALPMMQ
jgi:curved DNA-binding protein CbpA